MTTSTRSTHEQPKTPVPALDVQTLKDLSPRNDHRVIGGKPIMPTVR